MTSLMRIESLQNGDRYTRENRILYLASRAGLLLALIGAVAYGALVSPAFYTVSNAVNILTAMAIVGNIVVGMTFVLVVGGMADLSVPATVACGAILSLSLQPVVGVLPAFLMAVGSAGLCGLVNGLLIGYLRVNPIIATLGVGTVVLGVVQAFVGGVIVYGTDPNSAVLVNGRLFGIPTVVLLFAVVAIVGHFVLARTVWGRWTTATGGNYHAAEASAIPVRAVMAGAFVIVALTSGLSGAVLGLTLQSAQPFVGADYGFAAVTAVVVGGVSILGGAGSVLKAIAGLLLVQILANVMVLQGVPTPLQGFVLGIMIAISVSIDVYLRLRGVA